MPVSLMQQTSHHEFTANTDRRFRELSAEIASAHTNGGVGLGGIVSAPQAPKDRNVFYHRDCKLEDLGAKFTTARWNKWRRDLEGFIDTIGPS